MKCTILYQHRSHIATSFVKGGLNDGTCCLAIGVGLEIKHFSLEQHLVHQFLYTNALLRTDILALIFTSPFFDEQVHG